MPVPLPRRVTGRRTARASVEVWSLTVLAHWAAGGELPSLPWLVGVAALVAGATAWVLREQVRPVVMAPVLVACQLVLHVLFASLGPAGHASHAHQNVDLGPRMLAAHVACAVLTAVVWWVRRSVVEVVLRLAQALVVTKKRIGVPATATHGTGTTPVWLVGDPGRAPPRVLAPS